jgi:hypothetical protein
MTVFSAAQAPSLTEISPRSRSRLLPHRHKLRVGNKLAKLGEVEDMATHSDNVPLLPDEAFTRESFYQDHD